MLSEDETLTQLATTAAQRVRVPCLCCVGAAGRPTHSAPAQALEMAGVAASELDLVVMCTSSPDDSFGGACLVQAALGATGAAAFDLTAACSGFVMGLVTASQFIRTGGARNVLVIGADALSRFVDWRDRGTCILFGDGAGAVVLTSQPGAPCSLLGFDLNSDGTGNKHLTCALRPTGGSDGSAKPLSGGASEQGRYSNITMNGGEVFKFAVRSVPITLAASLKAAGLTAADIDWLVMHQANQRILDSVAQRLELPPDRVVSNIARYGNTSAASIPLALDEAVRAGSIKPGQVLAMSGFGAGLSWTSAIVKWG